MIKRKINVGLIFGGKSGEHQVSLQSAKSIHTAFDKKKYKVILIGVDKKGIWRIGDSSNYLIHAENPKLIALNKQMVAVFPLQKKDKIELVEIKSNRSLAKIDIKN